MDTETQRNDVKNKRLAKLCDIVCTGGRKERQENQIYENRFDE